MNKQKNNEKIVELYLFVNPFGTNCLAAEEQALRLIEDHKGKFHFRVIAFHNLQTVKKYMKALNIDMSKQKETYENIYQACLAFKAAELQGRKKGREFLLTLQKSVVLSKLKFSYDLVLQTAKHVGLDVSMFQEDLHSDLVKKAFESDQKIAQEMTVEQNPSAVFFNAESDDCGYIIDNCLTPEILESMYQEMVAPHPMGKLTSSSHAARNFARRHLHVL